MLGCHWGGFDMRQSFQGDPNPPPQSVVESIVGHSSPAMTRHYTHTSEAAAGAAVAALPDITGQAPAKPALPAPAALDAASCPYRESPPMSSSA